MRVLFLTKSGHLYGHHGKILKKSSGLYNSTRFVVKALLECAIPASIVEVIDGNCIDREVTRYYDNHKDGSRKPMLVVLEALWVTPEKIAELKALHPKVKWWCHLHSNVPFLAQEGMSMDWIIAYGKLGVSFIANDLRHFYPLKELLPPKQLVFLPNCYIPDNHCAVRPDVSKPYLDIGCFGAVRPLKNHLMQALAAIRFARERGKKLRFHINATRVETGGNPVLKNLRQLFGRLRDAELVESDWHAPDKFLKYLHDHIDIGMQVSLTETFNVVSADYVSAGIPMVVSDEVQWASSFNKANAHIISDIVAVMDRAYDNRPLIWWNQQLLEWKFYEAQSMWCKWVRANK